MSQAPAMPVFTDALIGDTTHLSTEEFGAYCLILFATWRNNGNPLIDDDNRLARVCRASKERWLKRLRPVIIAFFDVSDGRLRQKRLEKEWKRVAEKVEANRRNGTRGGRPSALENKETQKPNGFGLSNPQETQTEPNQNHNQIQEEERDKSLSPSPAALKRELEAEFDELWKLFPRKVARGQALKAFLAARRSASLADIERGVMRHRQEVDGKEPQFIPHPATWLNGQRWLDEPQEATRANGHQSKQTAIESMLEGFFGAVAARDAARH